MCWVKRWKKRRSSRPCSRQDRAYGALIHWMAPVISRLVCPTTQSLSRVALLRNHQVEMGVVYDPSRKECFAAARGHGAWLNEQPLQLQQLSTPLSQGMALIDLKRLNADLASRLAAQPPYSSQRSFGSVALDWCWLAAGRCHVYLHGRQKLWDYAAGCLILAEAGGSAVTLEGEPVFKPTLEPRSAAAALDPEIFAQWKAWLGITER